MVPYEPTVKFLMDQKPIRMLMGHLIEQIEISKIRKGIQNRQLKVK